MSETRKKSVRFTIDTSLNNAFVKLGEINKNQLLPSKAIGSKKITKTQQVASNVNQLNWERLVVQPTITSVKASYRFSLNVGS